MLAKDLHLVVLVAGLTFLGLCQGDVTAPFSHLGDKRRQPTLWPGGRDPNKSGRDGPTTSTTYNCEADVITTKKGAFSQLEEVNP